MTSSVKQNYGDGLDNNDLNSGCAYIFHIFCAKLIQQTLCCVNDKQVVDSKAPEDDPDVGKWKHDWWSYGLLCTLTCGCMRIIGENDDRCYFCYCYYCNSDMSDGEEGCQFCCCSKCFPEIVLEKGDEGNDDEEDDEKDD
eukprot:TRINITY_DN667_c0_g1_i2.p1 TRINITY_DN667_c0_g1~~TRINITY_DN667_c0_g1_i2.p1  ORF type:complete len:140 (+),score=48.38 TRINITY_DN667_c0_g1_i2:93-512(+)